MARNTKNEKNEIYELQELKYEEKTANVKMKNAHYSTWNMARILKHMKNEKGTGRT